ncbi:hypothetical protein FC093_14030 [Ilyomonas limi]|uniref:Ava_C0101 and related proteins n=2 Tax=Ilyomonas limi TaxID=2575867 RepID=A0A4U3L1Z1_9BACT|nr:hypothetical protein FC093_14030 [Ilyomonas limi]
MNTKTYNMSNSWPELTYEALKDTVATVQLWAQIVGKVRLVKMPWINHSWHVTLYLSASGITTGSVPYSEGLFQIDFDFIQHTLSITTSTGKQDTMQLYARPVADFYKVFMEKLNKLGIEATIYASPNELDPVIPFAMDNTHREYNPEQMHALWQAWIHIHVVFTKFRAKFIGKCSPVHIFWGAFDLAVTRFSGRRAPLHPGGSPNIPLRVMQEAYSHEVSSCGFWVGNDQFPYPVFYAYCYPTPEAFSKMAVQPKEAFYSHEMGEFFLSYKDVITSADPENYLLQFLQSTYEAAAETGNWNRKALEEDLSVFEKHYS